MPEDGLHSWIGKEKDRITEAFGQPERIDPTGYGYEWWIYSENKEKYMQIGIAHGKAVTLLAIGENLPTTPFVVGKISTEVFKHFPIESNIPFTVDGNYYRFEIGEGELQIRPLIKVSEELAIQLYFDRYTQQLAGVRYLTPEVLVQQRPYSIVYRGELEDSSLTREEWENVEAGEEQQIFDITNILRSRFGLDPLVWNINVADVAFEHSKDMSVNSYFSHSSPTAGELADRLKQGKVSYVQAGENIAAKYPDAAAAVMGWLNSIGHREAMLNDAYTDIGVGVYQKYYTQNFIKP
ncbi:CAP domain-containing protein [Pseudalkalibacillus caeni]|uniref:SCP-like extracellular n=1 Tax=Exobacillus caeni TaxID=2574798 RepID=A0A5R9F7Q3_9BACL|nr:CAP domain-containing protein [Pseudalkalibacillus caeni]TLS37658.1 hypothetical protein FCL54_07470 [Pseudalkalibacillus caeni]